jgi:hypothetical protein
MARPIKIKWIDHFSKQSDHFCYLLLHILFTWGLVVSGDHDFLFCFLVFAFFLEKSHENQVWIECREA